ncbi:MAG: class I SAM-dependent methyltransferase [Acidimicrobiales bacterium]
MHAARTGGRCRSCGETLTEQVVDLGMHPPCQRFLTTDEAEAMEPFYPLVTWACSNCCLVQIGDQVAPENIFEEYAYFSSYSDSWVDHVRRYAHDMKERFDLGPDSLVVEVASNDGYMLQWFVEMGVPVLGIEPARNIAEVAQAKGVNTLSEFFDKQLAEKLVADGVRADLLAGKNVLAQIPDLNPFVAGMATLLADNGVITIEFPHLQRLIEGNQFDTIYHEHYSYFSLWSTEQLFARHGLTIFDVDELPTHGGSLRIYARHADNTALAVTDRVGELRERERALGYIDRSAHLRFDEQVKETKRALLSFLIDAKRRDKSVVGYGAAGKGMTMLNYCGIGPDFVDFVVDRNPYKQGRFCPGSHIPVLPVDALWDARPDYVLILPWNLRDEISEQLSGIREWDGQFVVPIPTTEVW